MHFKKIIRDANGVLREVSGVIGEKKLRFFF